jgi:hypothetical protein
MTENRGMIIVKFRDTCNSPRRVLDSSFVAWDLPIFTQNNTVRWEVIVRFVDIGGTIYFNFSVREQVVLKFCFFIIVILLFEQNCLNLYFDFRRSTWTRKSWNRLIDWFLVLNATFSNISTISWRQLK